jgi:hypothetical protein
MLYKVSNHLRDPILKGSLYHRITIKIIRVVITCIHITYVKEIEEFYFYKVKLYFCLSVWVENFYPKRLNVEL